MPEWYLIIVALDTEDGKILVRGWQDKLRLRPERGGTSLRQAYGGPLTRQRRRKSPSIKRWRRGN
jgi:hypothetical protein